MLRKLSLLLLGPLLASGCQQPVAEETLSLNILKRSAQCRNAESGIRELHSREEALQLVAPLTMLQQTEPHLPSIDFSTQAVVVLAMGEQPSSGYRIEIEASGLLDGRGRLTLPVRFAAPDQEVVATVITTPCVIFSFRREGVREIVAGDTGLTLRLAPGD